MRLTKLGHSCLLVEEGGARLLLDPGTLSGGFEELEGLTAVLFTHQHADHLDQARLRGLLERNPRARVVSDQGSAEPWARPGWRSRWGTTARNWTSAGSACAWPGVTTRSSTPTSRWCPTSGTWSAGGCSTPATRSPRQGSRSRCWRCRPGRRG